MPEVSRTPGGQTLNPQGRTAALPVREQNAYKRMLNCLQQKQFKQGLKAGKQILTNSKYSNHPETLAIQGLLLLGIGKFEEAEQAVREGLKADLRSHACWNSLALIQKDLKKYSEAIKCFRNCLKLEPKNEEVLRNLSVLCIQTRDLEGYRDTRFNIFQLKPTQRVSWAGLALSYHLLGDYEMAMKLLDELYMSQRKVDREVVGQFIQSFLNKKTEYDIEYSEMLKYHIKVLIEAGKFEQALKILNENTSTILDKGYILEIKYRILEESKPGESGPEVHQPRPEVEKILEEIIKRNPGREDMYLKLIEEKRLMKDDEIAEFCSGYSETSDTPLILALKLCSGVVFRGLCLTYLSGRLEKRVPTAMQIFKGFYSSQPKKVELIHQVLLQLGDRREQGEGGEGIKRGEGGAEGAEEGVEGEEGGEVGLEEDVGELELERELWWQYYLSQHHLYAKQYDQAVESVEKCIKHSPNVPEVHLLKGRILKHQGDLVGALEQVERAFSLDPGDKYLGSKVAKYQLRAGLIQSAINTMGKFTKSGEGVLSYLESTQCLWFFLHLARAYHRENRLGDCLSACYTISNIFKIMESAEYDFHQYSLLKLRLSAYVDLLRNSDSIRQNYFFIEAATLAVEVYIKLHDQNVENKENNNLPNIVKKQKKKKKELKNNELNSSPTVSADLDICNEPLENCKFFLNHLLLVAQDELLTHELAASVYLRTRKPLLVLQTLHRMQKCPNSQDSIIKFSAQLSREIQNSVMDVRIKSILTKSLEKLSPTL